MLNSFEARGTLEVDGRSYDYYRLAAEQAAAGGAGGAGSAG